MAMEAVRKQAMTTFARTLSSPLFEENMTKLHSLMNAVTSTDVKLDHSLLTSAVQKEASPPAPVTYVEILATAEFTLNMFILRVGSWLPLHDHPLMHGICKVVHGKVKIRSFTPTRDPLASLFSKTIEAYREEDIVATAHDKAVRLSPDKGNIHEISPVDGPAAFVDVLAPPYRTFIAGYGPRNCHYYVEIDPADDQVNAVKTLVRTTSSLG